MKGRRDRESRVRMSRAVVVFFWLEVGKGGKKITAGILCGVPIYRVGIQAVRCN